MWWNCFSGRSTGRPTGRKPRGEDDEVIRGPSSNNHHAHIKFEEIIEQGTQLPMPGEDEVNEKFTKIVVRCIRTSLVYKTRPFC